MVTGGAGFIGANLVRSLLEDGWDVVVVDDFSTGRRSNLPDGQASEVRSDRAVLNIWESDVARRIPTPRGALDVIYHLACPASPPAYQADPLKTFNTAVKGTMNAVDLARRRHCRVVVASTSEVYGDPTEHPQHESYRGNVAIHGPRACYDEGKRAAETYAGLAAVDVVIARIHNTYGPWMRIDDGRMITNFLRAAYHDKPMPIYGDGSQTRCACYVDDMVRYLRTLGERPCRNRVYNVGSDFERTVEEIARQCHGAVWAHKNPEGTCPPPHKITHHPLPADDPVRRRPDLGRFRSEFGRDDHGLILAEGLRRTLAHLVKEGEL